MTTIQAAESDAGLQAWRQVRIAVLPHERTATLEEMRSLASGRHLFQIAERDGGVVVGSGTLVPSSLRSAGSIEPRVLPEYRRQGVGTAVLAYLLDLAREHGYPIAAADADDPGSARFAERAGFEEVDRQVEQVRSIGTDEPEPTAPPGVRVISVAQQPHLWRVAYQEIALAGIADMAVSAPMQLSPLLADADVTGRPSADLSTRG